MQITAKRTIAIFILLTYLRIRIKCMVIKNSQIVDEKFKMISYLALFTYQRTAPFFMLSLDSIELLRGTPLLVVDHGCCYGDDGT